MGSPQAFWPDNPPYCAPKPPFGFRLMPLSKQSQMELEILLPPENSFPLVPAGSGPGGKDLLDKNHEAASISWTGRASIQTPLKVFSWRGGDRPVARSARPILRKPAEASQKRASPADAFCPEGPYPRATTEASRKCQTLITPRQSRGFTTMKLDVCPLFDYGKSSFTVWIPFHDIIS